MNRLLLLVSSASLLVVGCVSTPDPRAAASTEKGPDNTVAYYVDIESSEPGVRIEADGEDAGLTPLRLKIYGDRDGTFHHFGRFEYVIRAIPSQPGQHVQTKVYHTGGFFTDEDRIPSRIFFQMNLTPGLRLDNPPPTR